MNYTTLVDVKDYLVKEIDGSYTSAINGYIAGVSRWMDKTCNRVLASNTPSTMKFDGSGNEVLLIKDCCDITAVVLDDVDITAQVLKYPTTKPYASRLVLQGGNYWTPGLQNVSVTGKFGMSASLQDDIKLAATILVGAICRNQILGDKAGTTERIGNYSITYSQEQKADIEMAKNIINSYKRIAL